MYVVYTYIRTFLARPADLCFSPYLFCSKYGFGEHFLYWAGFASQFERKMIAEMSRLGISFFPVQHLCRTLTFGCVPDA